MQRYFVKKTIDEHLVIDDHNQVHHIRNVMRMKRGDQAVVCDLLGHCFYMQIMDIKVKEVHFKKGQALPKLNRQFHLTLAQSLIRKDHFELACQKATELGVDTIIPIKTSRTIIKLKEDVAKQKRQRWEMISKEASEQSRRTSLVHIENIAKLEDLDYNMFDMVLVAYESEQNLSLRESLKALKKDSKILVIVGPEGGFSDEEIVYLKSQGVKSVSLGPRILRGETAAIFLLSVLSYELELVLR